MIPLQNLPPVPMPATEVTEGEVNA
jgi:hypothetical protein